MTGESRSEPEPGGDPSTRTVPDRFRAAAGLQPPLLSAAGAAILATVSAFVAASRPGLAILGPVADYALLLAVALLASAWLVRLRARVLEVRERRWHAEAVTGVEPAGITGAPTPPGSRSEEDLEKFGRAGVAMLFGVAGAAVLVLALASLIREPAATPISPRVAIVSGAALAALALLLRVGSLWMAATPGSRLPEAPGLVQWLRGGQWVSLLTAAGFFARGLGFDAIDLDRWLARGLFGLVGLWALEMAIRGLARFVRSRVAWDEVVAPVELVTLTALFEGRSPLDGLTELAERHLGLSLRSTWAIGLVRRSLGPLLLAMLLVLWASTALVVVGPEEQGIRLRFGRLVSPEPLGPGLAVKLPWPLETVERYPVARVRTLGLGYAGPQKESLLWAQSHSGEEYKLLLGDGRELVSVDAVIAYRVRSALAYALGFQNPREALEALAYRLLMRETVVTNLDRLLSVGRAEFARSFATRLQAASDAQGLGLEILHVGFTSLHPPVDIALAYEAVVSAQVEGETMLARARAYRESVLPAAAAEVDKGIRDAEGEAARRVAEATGSAVAFEAAWKQFRAARQLFRFRRQMEALEDGLLDRSLFVVDDRLGAGAADLWIDLRPGAPAP